MDSRRRGTGLKRRIKVIRVSAGNKDDDDDDDDGNGNVTIDHKIMIRMMRRMLLLGTIEI